MGGESNRRIAFLVRFLLENVGGFLSLAGVIFAAGILYNKVDALALTVEHIGVQQAVQSVAISELKTDIAVVKTQVNAIEKRQNGAR